MSKTQTPLELFQQAYHDMHGKPTKYTAMKLARPQYYEAHKVGTLEAYLGAAHGVLNAQAEHKSEIWFAKKKIRKARDMCSMQGMRIPDATAGSSPGAGGRALSAIDISEEVAAAYATGAAPAGGSAARVVVSAIAATTPLDNTNRVVLSAPCNAGMMRVPIGDSLYKSITPALAVGGAAAAGVGFKRELEVVNVSSDDEQEKQPVTKKPTAPRPMSNAEGKAPADERLETDNQGKPWQTDVVVAMQKLTKKNGFSFQDMTTVAREKLCQLPHHFRQWALQLAADEALSRGSVNKLIVAKAKNIRKRFMDDKEEADEDQDDAEEEAEEQSGDEESGDEFVEKAWDYGTDAWRPEITNCMDELKRNSLCDFSKMSNEANDLLCNLPVEKALEFLKELPTLVDDFVCKLAQERRDEYKASKPAAGGCRPREQNDDTEPDEADDEADEGEKESKSPGY
jgi:hypothetical protein